MKVKIAITVDEEVSQKLKELAQKESRTLSSQINKILKDYFSQYCNNLKSR